MVSMMLGMLTNGGGCSRAVPKKEQYNMIQVPNFIDFVRGTCLFFSKSFPYINYFQRAVLAVYNRWLFSRLSPVFCLRVLRSFRRLAFGDPIVPEKWLLRSP